MTGAGACAVAAGVTVAISGVCLGLFFMTEREAWGRANDATVALFAVLMIPAVLDVGPTYAAALGVAGLIVIGVSSALTALGTLAWLLSAKIGGIGFAGFIVWMIAACLGGDLPDALRVLGLVTVALAAISLVVVLRSIKVHGRLFEGDAPPPTAVMIAPTATYLCLVAWVVGLGLAL